MKTNVNTSQGLSIFRSIDLDETEEEVSAGECVVFWIETHNNSAADRFIKLYNAAAADVAVGTTTPVITYVAEASTGKTFSIDAGLRFSTALSVAATTAVADADTGAPGTNDVLINIGYA